MLYSFGDYELDTQIYELRHAGKPVKTPPQVFNVLSYLVEHHDRTVTKQELLDTLWPDQYTSEAVLSYCVMTARKAVGDSGRTQRVIKTIHGRGFRFIADLASHSPQAATDKRKSEPAKVPSTHPPQLMPVPEMLSSESTPFVPTSEAFSPIQDDKQQPATVLCVTLANAVTLNERREFNALQRLRQAFFSLAQQEIQQQAGTLQFYGADGIMALFGIPEACEDHSRRALWVALRLQQRLHERLVELDARQAFQLSVRMGLHTGPVAIDSVSQDQRIASTALGATMNLAVWLQYLAPPGTLLLSANTMQRGDTPQLLQDMALHGQPVRVQVPGYADPVVAYTIHKNAATVQKS